MQAAPASAGGSSAPALGEAIGSHPCNFPFVQKFVHSSSMGDRFAGRWSEVSSEISPCLRRP